MLEFRKRKVKSLNHKKQELLIDIKNPNAHDY